MKSKSSNKISVARSLGKGEVERSIRSGSTTNPCKSGVSGAPGNPSRQFEAERSAKRAGPPVENPGTLFPARSYPGGHSAWLYGPPVMIAGLLGFFAERAAKGACWWWRGYCNAAEDTINALSGMPFARRRGRE